MKVKEAKNICNKVLQERGFKADYYGFNDEDDFVFMEVYHTNNGKYFGSVLKFDDLYFEASECYYMNDSGIQQINIFGYRKTVLGALKHLLKGNTTENHRIPEQVYY